MDKPPHQLEYRSAPHTYRQRVWWEVAWPLWLAIACLCGFVEWAVIVNAQGQINGWGQTALVFVFAVVGVVAVCAAMVAFIASYE